MARPRVRLVRIGGHESPMDLLVNRPELTLRELLGLVPSMSLEPIDEPRLSQPLEALNVSFVTPAPNLPLYLPPGGLHVSAVASSSNGGDASGAAAAPSATAAPLPPVDMSVTLPTELTEEHAVKLAYHRDIVGVASFLRAGLSALVVCDKLVVKHMWKEMVLRAGKTPKLLEVPEEKDGGLVPRGLRQRQLAELKTLMRALNDNTVLVIPHLDLLAGGADQNLPTESRELIELVYDEPSRLVLAFADRTQNVPEVLASRFAVRLSISGVPQRVVMPDQSEQPIGSVLVTKAEAAQFDGFDPEGLYKNIAGMNPVSLRHAVIYAVKEHAGSGTVPVSQLYHAIRAFKAQTSNSFEVTDVNFSQIGGYEDVKAEILRAIHLIEGSSAIPDEGLRRELIPRGFLLYGPPGTGKTLFAKAVANKLNATIQIVSGPEVTDMYVGESERKVRELFAEARRNAPAVLVFDEFDAIAVKRSGREDGGSRAGNAIVAQILTEMDGFRPDVPMLVIGTTNRLDIIDEALLRPSRFRAIKIGLPDKSARRAIAQVHADHFKTPLSDELLDLVAHSTDKMNGDELRSLFRDAYVAHHLEGQPPTARQFGRLVGKIRLAHQQREAAKSSQQQAPPSRDVRAGERPRPSESVRPIGASQTRSQESSVETERVS